MVKAALFKKCWDTKDIHTHIQLSTCFGISAESVFYTQT